MFDPEFWVGFSTTLFILIAFKYLKEPCKEFLDNRSKIISNKIDGAEALLKEAEQLYKLQEKLNRKSLKDIDDIKNGIDKEINSLYEQAQAELQDQINIKNSIVQNRINNNEKRLLREMRIEAADLAISNARTVLQQEKSSDLQIRLIKKSLDSIEQAIAS